MDEAASKMHCEPEYPKDEQYNDDAPKESWHKNDLSDFENRVSRKSQPTTRIALVGAPS
jgi:hypothetical protein